MEFSDELRWWWDELCHRPPGAPSAGAAPAGPGEFLYPVTASTLLATVPDPIWPPLMPPNFLPLIGNGAGDWLCLRLLDPDVAAKTGVTTDICHWYHGGGDWLPWGGRLSEALLFDWTLPRLPQSRRRYADPAIEPGGDDDSSNPVATHWADWNDHPWGRWVTECLPAVNEMDWKGQSGAPLAAEMLRHHLCEVPVRCQLIIDSLSSELSGRIDPNLAQNLGLAWNDLMRWCFDLRTMPQEIARRLETALGMPAWHFDPSQQNWDDVAMHAASTCQSHGDLSWGHDLLGYVKWSAGDSQAASLSFSNALRCSVFTDQSVRLRTHWATSSDGVAKFSARFLNDESDSDQAQGDGGGNGVDQLGRLPAVISRSRLLEYFGRCDAEGASSVRQRYSQMLVEESNGGHPASTRARLLYAAGWDLGAEPLQQYGDLLEQYIGACRQAGWTSHERLAEVHRGGLKARYNL